VENSDEKFGGWVILELMGRRRLTGYLSEQEIAGRAFLRIDIPGEPPVTQFYGAEAVYCITPTTEETARNAAALNQVAPIHRWELPPAGPAVRPGDEEYVDADIADEAGDGEYAHPF
jgi:hypothetical protein